MGSEIAFQPVFHPSCSPHRLFICCSIVIGQYHLDYKIIPNAPDVFQVYTEVKGTEVQHPALLEDLFVLGQPTRPELCDTPDIKIYGRPRLPASDHTKLRQGRDYDVLWAQWTEGAYCIAFNVISRFLPSFSFLSFVSWPSLPLEQIHCKSE